MGMYKNNYFYKCVDGVDMHMNLENPVPSVLVVPAGILYVDGLLDLCYLIDMKPILDIK